MAEEGWTASHIASLKRGDTAAFALFVREFQDMVFACGRTVGLRDDEIEDVAGETFLAAYKSIRSFGCRSKLSSWLWRIAYNKAVDTRRRRPSGVPLKGDEPMSAPVERQPPARLEKEEQSRLIWQGVQTLPESQAAAIVLFYREGRSIQEIADILETPENTVKTWLHRGRNELFTKLQSIQENDYVQR